MSEVGSIALIFIIFIVFPIVGVLYSLKLSMAYERKRDQMLKRLVDEDVEVIHGFPIDQRVEEIIQGGLRKTIQSYRELIVSKRWLFLQVTSRRLPSLTFIEDRSAVRLGLFSYELSEFSPNIAIRNRENKLFLACYLQHSIKNSELVWCEAAFDKDHNIYNEPESHLDTLSILSPEVLEKLMNAPGHADIILKRNQLYYILPGRLPAENILPSLLMHAEQLAEEINDNLNRWGRAMANQDKLAEIKATELSITLREKYERGLI